MRKRMLTVATLVAVCTACAPTRKIQMKATGSCVGDSAYAQVKITVVHDNTGKPQDIAVDPQEATIWLHPDSTIPSQKGQVCWVIQPTDGKANLSKLLQPLYLKSHNGIAAFETWTTKKKLPGDPLELASGIPNQQNPGWKYDLKCGEIDVDPKIIIIDESH